MKTAILCGITLIAAGPAFAQSSATGAAAGQTDATTVTLTGCVAGGGSEAKPITLSNALIIPGTSQPGQLDQTPSPVPATASSPATQPPDPTLPPPSATAVPAPPSAQSPVGTSGSKTPATTGTSGVGVMTGSGVGTATGAGVGTATGSGVGTATGSGVGTPTGSAIGSARGAGVAVTGTAPAGSSGASVTGYQLSGADMQPWIGKRVQVIGTWAPAATGSATAGAPAMREFKVQSVQPATGPCAK
jgi:hypothetical protein